MKRKSIFKLVTQLLALGLGLANSSTAISAVTQLDIAEPDMTDVLFTGPTGYQQGTLGYSQAVGDFNGDGIDDLALGAPGMSTPVVGTVRGGRVYLYYGGSNFHTLPAITSIESDKEDALLFGTSLKERAGDMLAVGDFNNDGADDLVIVGQYGVDGAGSTSITRLYVVYGRKAPALPITGNHALSQIADSTIGRQAAPPYSTWPDFQVSALATGDLNNDGYDDLVVSDKVNNEFRILMGKSAKWSDMNVDVDSGFVLRHSQDTDVSKTDYFPLYNQDEIAGVGIGDFNGDGKDDLAVGVPLENSAAFGSPLTDGGKVYLMFGGNRFTPGSTTIAYNIDAISDVTIWAGRAYDKIGGPLAFGDFNGDGKSDLVIGAPKSMQGQSSSTGLGKVEVVYGSSTPMSIVPLTTGADINLRLSRQADEGGVGRIGFYTGQSIIAKDINGDGYDDLAISSPGAFFNPGGDNGWVHLFYGSASPTGFFLLDQDVDGWFYAPPPTDPLASGRMGTSLAVGDFDNDGRQDLSMGAPKGAPDSVVSAGFIPLLFKPASTLACSGNYVAVTTEYPFSNGHFLCVGETSLGTYGNVTIESTASARFRSPAILLGKGFRVQTGAQFWAGNN